MLPHLKEAVQNQGSCLREVGKASDTHGSQMSRLISQASLERQQEPTSRLAGLLPWQSELGNQFIQTPKRSLILALGLTSWNAILLGPVPAKAAVVVNAAESRGNAVFTYSCAINTAGLIHSGSANGLFAYMVPQSGMFISYTGPSRTVHLGNTSYNQFGAGS